MRKREMGDEEVNIVVASKCITINHARNCHITECPISAVQCCVTLSWIIFEGSTLKIPMPHKHRCL